jgi:glycosyltransferase involved in cell wall biosynthesis
MKIIVTHPGKQHSYRVATALKKHNVLFKYITTVYNKDHSILMRITKFFIRRNDKERANLRKCSLLTDNDVIQFCEFRGLLLLLIIRLDKSKKIASWLLRYVSKKFQQKIAHYAIKNNVDAIISYDTNSEILFRILKEKAPSIIRIIDHAHPARNYLYEIYQNYMEKSGVFAKTFEDSVFLTDKNYSLRFAKEIEDADYHIVASSFSKKAVQFNNIPDNKIFLIPYGVNINTFKINPHKNKNNSILKILFVGEVNQRKGIYQILEAAKDINSSNIEFNIIGRGRDYCSDLYKQYEKYVNFYGHVSFEQLVSFFANSHVFVFPALGEGFGLVIPEALSAGLPVITTPNCCGADIIRDGYNGFIINPCDTQALKKKILLFKDNILLSTMSENAIISVQDLTWEHYYDNLNATIEQIMNKK